MAKNGIKKSVLKHLKEDIHESKESIREDKSLGAKIRKAAKKPKKK